MNIREVVKIICKNRGILEIPEDCPPIMKDIMLQCLKYEAERRPSFDNLQLVFDKLANDNSLLQEESISNPCFTSASVEILENSKNDSTNSDLPIQESSALPCPGIKIHFVLPISIYFM